MNESETGSVGNGDRSSKDVNAAIEDLLSRSSRIKISGLKGQDNVAIGLKGSSEIDIHGSVGRYLGAFNMGPVIVLKGDCGDLAADNLVSGGLIIFGNCGNGCGSSMTGGIVVVKGDTGEDLGMANRNGTIIIDGNVNGNAADRMSGGRIIVTGDIRGTLGKKASGGTIYVAGEIDDTTGSIDTGNMDSRDNQRLKKYFDHYGIDAFTKGFRKYVIKEGN